jgi:hypothetical protein
MCHVWRHFYCHNWRKRVPSCPVGRGQGCWTTYSAQDSPQSKEESGSKCQQSWETRTRITRVSKIRQQRSEHPALPVWTLWLLPLLKLIRSQKVLCCKQPADSGDEGRTLVSVPQWTQSTPSRNVWNVLISPNFSGAFEYPCVVALNFSTP